MNVIGITGLAGAGKDTVADHLVKDWGFARVALADPLKRICRDAFAFTDEQLWGPSANRNAPDLRYPREHAAKTAGVLCSCCGADVEVEATRPCYLTPRYALQLLGTEWGRHCYDGVWVDYAMRLAAELLGASSAPWHYDPRAGLTLTPSQFNEAGACKGVVISDVRFENEARAICRAGGKVWRVERPGAGLGGAGGQHVSERGIPDDLVDRTVPNEGTFAELHGLIDALMGGF